MDEKIKYWTDLSEYDLETAEAMLTSGRYLYVGFMCHQTIEKILKAYFTGIKSDTVPFTHSLSYIAKKAEIYSMFSDSQKSFIDLLEPLNIEARYPADKDKIFNTLTYDKCADILIKTKELQKWIKEKL
jgi:HEPN domain-containing protein